MKIVVLGAGLVGGPMALDLAKESGFEVTVADIRDEALERVARGTKIRVVKTDLSDVAEVAKLANEHDLVLSAVPGFMGFATLRAVLETGTSCVDIAFFPEDPLELDSVAKKHSATAFVDMGVGPGMSSVLAGHAFSQLDTTDSILTYVGGLPRIRRWPYEYAAVFSPATSSRSTSAPRATSRTDTSSSGPRCPIPSTSTSRRSARSRRSTPTASARWRRRSRTSPT